MEHNELEHKLRHAAKNAIESVGNNTWDRLDLRLEQKTQKEQIFKYKWLASAAAAIALLAMAYIFTSENNSYNPDLIASAEHNGLIMESLDTKVSEFYDVKKVQQMTQAYDALGLK